MSADQPARPEPGAALLKWFEWGHLQPRLAGVSLQFHALALWMVDNLPPGPERTTALRKLLEAKDAAVRAELDRPEVEQ